MIRSAETPGNRSGTGKRRRLFAADVLTLALVFGLMSAVYLLPPDTSLAEVQRNGALKVCVPQAYPPLVMPNPEQPGFDVSVLEAIAARLQVKLSLNTNPQMGKDFNPRNWSVNRAQCELLAGGVVTSQTTRSFLETLDTGIETGWAVLRPKGAQPSTGLRVGVFPGLGGLDRLALSAYLREQGARGVLRPTLEALEAGLVAGDLDMAVTESLGARQLAIAHPEWDLAWLPPRLGRYSLGFGLWKGDLTLKRALSDALEELEAEGVLAQLMDRYGIVPIDAVVQLGS